MGFKGFTLGGSIGQDNNGLGSNYYTGQNNDMRYYSAGLMYETGPWQLSAGWMGARNNNGNGSQTVGAIAPGTNLQTLNTPASTSAAFSQNQTGALRFGQESVDKFEIGINYALGPGVKLTGGGLYYNATGPTMPSLATAGVCCSVWICASSRRTNRKSEKSGRKPALFFVPSVAYRYLEARRPTRLTNRPGR